MAIQRKLRRGTTAENDAFTGAVGEVVQDTDLNNLRVHDASQTGGFVVPNYLQQIKQSYIYATVDGSSTANAYVLTLEKSLDAYTEGTRVEFKATANNTGATTVNIDTLGVKNIKKYASGAIADLEADDIVNGNIYRIVYDGTQFLVNLGGGGGGATLVASATASNDATIDLDNVFQSGFRYHIIMTAIVSTSDGDAFQSLVSGDGGSTYETVGYRYNLQMFGGDGNLENNSAASWSLGTSHGSAGTESFSGVLVLNDPANSGIDLHCTSQACYRDDTGGIVNMVASQNFSGAVAIDSIRFQFNAGNIESGEFTVYEEALS